MMRIQVLARQFKGFVTIYNACLHLARSSSASGLGSKDAFNIFSSPPPPMTGTYSVVASCIRIGTNKVVGDVQSLTNLRALSVAQTVYQYHRTPLQYQYKRMGQCILRRGERQCGLVPAPVCDMRPACDMVFWGLLGSSGALVTFIIMSCPHFACSTQAPLLSTICIRCIDTGCARTGPYRLTRLLANERRLYPSGVYHTVVTGSCAVAEHHRQQTSRHVTVPEQDPNLHTHLHRMLVVCAES